jgi:hypothetical protein
MVTTYKQGLLAFSFLAAVCGGCTYSEDELHARHPDNDAPIDRPSGSADLPVAPGAFDAGISIDAEGVDSLGALDSSPAVDVPAYVDSSSAGGELDSGRDSTHLDLVLHPGDSADQAMEMDLPDASDLPPAALDASIDVSHFEVHVTEAGVIRRP